MRVKLGIGSEQFVSAGCADIGTAVFGICVFAREWPLCSLFTQDMVLLRRQYFTPLLFGFDNLVTHVVLHFLIAV